MIVIQDKFQSKWYEIANRNMLGEQHTQKNGTKQKLDTFCININMLCDIHSTVLQMLFSEIDRVATTVRVLCDLEIVCRQPKWLEDNISQLL